jgi:hypothetical protein
MPTGDDTILYIVTAAVLVIDAFGLLFLAVRYK